MKYLFSTIYFLFILQYCRAQAPIQRLHNYCPIDSVLASNNIAQYIGDSLMIVAGNTESPGITTYNTYLATLDAQLNPVKEKELYFPGLYNSAGGGPYIIAQPSPDKYILSGMELTGNGRNQPVYNPYFYFFNNDLDSIGFIKYVDTNRERLPVAIALEDSKNIVVAGSITGFGYTFVNSQEGKYDSVYVWIARYDSNANILWERQFSGNALLAVAHKITVCADGSGYIISGEAAEHQSGNNFIAKMDTSGNLLWQKFLQRPEQSVITGMDHINLDSSNYLFASSYSDTLPGPGGPGNSYFYYGKLNSLGDTVWTRNIRFNRHYEVGEQLIKSVNGTAYIKGRSYYNGFYHPSVLEIDSSGSPLSYHEYLYRNLGFNQRISSITPIPHHKLFLSGFVATDKPIPNVFDSSGSISWFIQTDTAGCLTPGCPIFDTLVPANVAVTNTKDADIFLYPNPAHEKLYIKTGQTGKLDVLLIDMYGKEQFNTSLEENSSTPIELNKLPPGFYTVIFYQNGEMIKSSKFSHW